MSDHPQLRSLLDTVQVLTALQQQLALVLPPYFISSCQVIGLRQGTLAIAVSNGTLAAKLRQLAPEIVNKLQNIGCEVSGIRVKVQVSYAIIPPKPTPRILTNTAQNQLHELSRCLDDSPLKQAVEKFLKNKD
ncbi:MAG: DciA family protein [Gallionella sp.]